MRMPQLKQLLFQFLPPVCPICNRPVPVSNGVVDYPWCHTCTQGLFHQTRCQQCGITTPYAVNQCGTCLQHPPLWQRLFCLSNYEVPVSQCILQAKHQRQFWKLDTLISQLATHITDPAPLMLPVPLHWRRYLFRGFNQSTYIARQLSQRLGISYQTNVFKRVQSTTAQQTLNQKERQKNMDSVFVARRVLDATHVALVDDVVTTGSTLSPLCKLLYDMGIEKIDVYCLCRTQGSE